VNKVTSRDGTTIAFDRSGEGPPVILVGGAFQHRAFGSSTVRLASLLARHFTVVHYDRRGRGDSGDTLPYAIDREIEDLEALVTEVGGAAFVFGMSSGGALALEAAVRGLDIAKLALYEPPFIVDDSRPRLPEDFATQLAELVSASRRGDAVELFMTRAAEAPVEVVAQMRNTPSWRRFEAVAHTLVYDITIMGDNNPLPTERVASITIPTLAIDGGASPVWMRNAVQAVADTLPNARHRTLEGQTHVVDPDVLAPVLEEFFMTDNNVQAHEQTGPNPALESLEVMVGKWDVSGPDIHGHVTFEWMEGGFYLVQRVDFDHVGRKIKGVEYIGYDESNEVLKSYFFGNTGPGPFGGTALDYVWEVGDHTLTIWGGFVGSPAKFEGRFSDDCSTVIGRWEWPGGGYEATMTRAK
jgi:pimeloyl-ACP methyl ester carboxylesterase